MRLRVKLLRRLEREEPFLEELSGTVKLNAYLDDELEL